MTDWYYYWLVTIGLTGIDTQWVVTSLLTWLTYYWLILPLVTGIDTQWVVTSLLTCLTYYWLIPLTGYYWLVTIDCDYYWLGTMIDWYYHWLVTMTEYYGIEPRLSDGLHHPKAKSRFDPWKVVLPDLMYLRLTDMRVRTLKMEAGKYGTIELLL